MVCRLGMLGGRAAPIEPRQTGWPNRQPSLLMATFLLLPWSRGAIGRVRGTPGALSTAGRTRRRDELNPRCGKGVNEVNID